MDCNTCQTRVWDEKTPKHTIKQNCLGLEKEVLSDNYQSWKYLLSDNYQGWKI